MTRTDREICLTPTQGLANHHKFYPAKIPVSHHQLRHHISTQEGEFIYYVSHYDICVLDLQTQQNSLLATIPFEARCLAADLGWVGVGGEVNGDCAFVKIEKDEHGHPKCFGHDLVVDLLGGEIVNSMNIHNMMGEGQAPDEPVVLISNNDKTVKVYSLAQRQVLNTLVHPVPMNFSAMSPDSTILAAVGDSDKVYFYRRKVDETSDPNNELPGKFLKYDWIPFARPTVPTGDPVFDDYSFAVTFSPTGHLCAASAQGGSISVFDMNQLDRHPESSIICTFRSSRPTLLGCVRAMAFSPAPWDILAWAEDHGRVGLADVRRHFIRRQILELDRRKAQIIELEDGTPVAYRNLGVKERLKQQHVARLRALRRRSSRDQDLDISMEDTPTETGRQRHSRQDLLSYHQGLDLDARERSVVEALETTMDNVEQSSPRPFSINYTSSPRLRSSLLASEPGREYGMQLPDSNTRPTRAGHHQPRRRSSVILSESTAAADLYLSPPDGQRARISASPGRISDDEDIPIMSTNDLTPSASRSNNQLRPSRIPPSDPWHVIQAALESARESDEGNRAQLARIEAALDDERQLAHQLERQLSEERQLATLLREQLDSQQRLLAENSSELDQLRAAAGDANSRVNASFERVLHRQLANEELFLQQRSQELQAERRLGTDLARRLETERARILTGEPPQAESSRASSQADDHASSAQTSALPTTNVRSSQSRENPANILENYSETRTQRRAHVDNLQRQVRQAETRIAQATSDIQTLETIVRRETAVDDAVGSRPRRRYFDESQSSRPVSGAGNPSTRGVGTTPRSATRRRPSISMDDVRASRDARAALVGRVNDLTASTANTARIVQDADLRLARMMFISSNSGNRGLDANGNWLPGSSVHRLLAGGSALSTGNVGPGSTSGNTASSTVDVVREMGLGTAGIGFSPDGRYL
ncbi:uncharacterized protein A1O9_06344 [Exophiala aquamarina CBS 119918]|uniref:DUF2415 domain-containing protein n=1 Tax=Exophiala aquamarina CBS 119918 TaxID=1182545 RepID=A0A072PGJ3_9EURO|nr:uncharacterized protein A1O9_06344 [Exophiala aquamarina CBS 119918]KEF58418.1 hypothetical protein A1O9_06344 [Exophiala aquamarina CBS 119918]